MAAVPSPWHEATVLRIERATARSLSVFVQAAVPRPVAGQHLVVRLSAPDGYEASRSYSIASAPDAADIELLVERIDDGEVSPFLHDVLRPGDRIDVRGPLGGHFIWRPEASGPLLLVAGGSGIAPLMAMVRDWARHATSVPLLLIASVRRWDDLAFRDELLALQARETQFAFVAATTRETTARPGHFIQRLDGALLRQCLQRWRQAPRHVYVCGANRFVEAMAGGLLDAGVPASAIRTERYGGA